VAVVRLPWVGSADPVETHAWLRNLCAALAGVCVAVAAWAGWETGSLGVMLAGAALVAFAAALGVACEGDRRRAVAERASGLLDEMRRAREIAREGGGGGAS
jgi:hypothetical protein